MSTADKMSKQEIKDTLILINIENLAHGILARVSEHRNTYGTAYFGHVTAIESAAREILKEVKLAKEP